MKLLYFASLRQKIGLPEEDVDVPAYVRNVADLIDWLMTRGPGYEAAFENRKLIRAAIDQEHAKLDALLGSPKEVAFFPPVTGG
ncbi:MAG: molybdopterin converting factor subunit 1 [Parvibaculum sp.]|nr:molybdopterin converting factor subunit 1 [Parvibaculum sp.]